MVKQGMPFVEIETIAKVTSKETKAPETIVQETLNTITDTNKKIPEKTKQNNQPINYKNTSIHSGPATRKLAREFGINLLEDANSITRAAVYTLYKNKIIDKTQLKKVYDDIEVDPLKPNPWEV